MVCQHQTEENSSSVFDSRLPSDKNDEICTDLTTTNSIEREKGKYLSLSMDVLSTEDVNIRISNANALITGHSCI